MLVHQVSELITEASFYLVCKVSYAFTIKLLPYVKVESSMDILTMKDCWIEDKAFQQDYPSTFLMLKKFKSGHYDYKILSAIEVSAYKEELSTSIYRTVLTIPSTILYMKIKQLCWKMIVKD